MQSTALYANGAESAEFPLPSMTELLELYGVNYDEMTEGWGTSGATGENIKIVNDELNCVENERTEIEEIRLYDY